MVRVSAFDVKESNRCNLGGSRHVIRVIIEFSDMAGLPYRIEYYEIPHGLFNRMRLKSSFPISKSGLNDILNLDRMLKYKLVTEEKEILSIVNIINKIRSDTLPNSLVGSKSVALDGVSFGGMVGLIYGIDFSTGSVSVCVNNSYSLVNYRDVKFI